MNDLGFAYVTTTHKNANALLTNGGLKSDALEIINDDAAIVVIDAFAYGTSLKDVEAGAFGRHVVLKIDLNQVPDIVEVMEAASEVNVGYDRLAIGNAPFTVAADFISYRDDKMADFEPLATIHGDENVAFDAPMAEDDLIAQLDATAPETVSNRPVYDTPFLPRNVWFAQQRAAGRVFNRRKGEAATSRKEPVKRERTEAQKRFLRGLYARREAARNLSV